MAKSKKVPPLEVIDLHKLANYLTYKAGFPNRAQLRAEELSGYILEALVINHNTELDFRLYCTMCLRDGLDKFREIYGRRSDSRKRLFYDGFLSLSVPDHEQSVLQFHRLDTEDFTDYLFPREVSFEEIFEVVPAKSKRDEDMIKLLYSTNFTLAEVGDEFGVSESRVCQVYKQWLKKWTDHQKDKLR
jgi:hypothetical protein